MERAYNTRCPAVKRILREVQELHVATEEYYAEPLEDNLFEWHFTIRGPIDSDFEEGIYHGRILLPSEYPMKPPNIIFTTMNGRFETNRKICLSISGHHPESWQPSWSIRTALLAIIGYLPSSGYGHLASVDYSPEERRKLAKRSLQFVCPECGAVADLLKPRNLGNATKVSLEAKQISQQMAVTEKTLSTSETSASEDPSPNTTSTTATTTSTSSISREAEVDSGKDCTALRLRTAATITTTATSSAVSNSTNTSSSSSSAAPSTTTTTATAASHSVTTTTATAGAAVCSSPVLVDTVIAPALATPTADPRLGRLHNTLLVTCFFLLVALILRRLSAHFDVEQSCDADFLNSDNNADQDYLI